MSRAPRRTNAVTAIKEGSPQDRIAQVLYDHDALRATVPWRPWRLATRPKRLLYLSRAAAVIAAMKDEKQEVAERTH